MAPNLLWECPLQIERGSSTDMPEDWLGAFVSYFVAAPTYEVALRAAVAAASERGYVFKDVPGGQVFQIELHSGWKQYVAQRYKGYEAHFPSAAEFERIMEAGGLFHSPFAGWSGHGDA